MAPSSRKPAWLAKKSRLRGGQTLATWLGKALDIAEINSAPQRRT
jgi:hypothetical protein